MTDGPDLQIEALTSPGSPPLIPSTRNGNLDLSFISQFSEENVNNDDNNSDDAVSIFTDPNETNTPFGRMPLNVELTSGRRRIMDPGYDFEDFSLDSYSLSGGEEGDYDSDYEFWEGTEYESWERR